MSIKPENQPDTKHIFLVEDDERLADLTREYLEAQGFLISHEIRGDLAVDRILEEQPDLIILDLMLPGLNGIEVYKQIQSEFTGSVLMFTAKDDDIDQILGLELGADDYVTKPVQPRVLLARVNTLLRRQGKTSETPKQNKKIRFGHFLIDSESRQISLDHSSIELTTNEFELLWFLATNAGVIKSREEILSAVRGIEYDGLDRWVDIRISRLRNKLGDDADHPEKIKTVWGKGYLFVKNAWG